MIWGRPPESIPFSSERYEPFWQAASDFRMPLSLHIGSGGDRGARERAESGQPYWHNMDALISLPSEVQCALTTITFSGALERHPGLVLISAEYDLGWMPYFLQNLDRLYQRWSPPISGNLCQSLSPGSLQTATRVLSWFLPVPSHSARRYRFPPLLSGDAGTENSQSKS